MMTTTKRFYIQTFGCQMNVSDSEKMAALLKQEGYVATESLTDADLILLNTCSVRAKAETKVYRILQNLRPLKKDRKVIIGVGGCVAQQEGEKLLKRLPYLDLVFGTHTVYLLPELVRLAGQGKRQVAVDFANEETRQNLFPNIVDSGRLTKFVTIMQGCDNFCTYCIVPHVRGREISRPFEEIIKEVTEAADKGVKEVTLLGQNVNSYGSKGESSSDFADLLRRVARIDGIERIRFTTSHPKDLSPRLVDCFADLPKLCPHIHLPAQSGSNNILSRMNRGYTREQYLSKVDDLKSARPDMVITTDIIAGFPGETEADFAETLALIEAVNYIDVLSFIYSPRPGTKAADLPEQLSYEEKLARLDKIGELKRRFTMLHHEKLVGTVQEVLVEGEGKREGQMTGRLGSSRIVNFHGDRSLAGRIIGVKIIKANPNSLLGELID